MSAAELLARDSPKLFNLFEATRVYHVALKTALDRRGVVPVLAGGGELATFYRRLQACLDTGSVIVDGVVSSATQNMPGNVVSQVMGSALRKVDLNVEVVCDPKIMSGDPVVSGTRVPAETVVAYLRAGHTDQNIYEDYPTLQPGAIDAVRRWAEREYGAGWLNPLQSPAAGR